MAVAQLKPLRNPAVNPIAVCRKKLIPMFLRGWLLCKNSPMID
jgi:hypothetical protein